MSIKQMEKCVTIIIWLCMIIGVHCTSESSVTDEFTAEVESCTWFPDAKVCGYVDMEFHGYRKCSFGRKAVICKKTITTNNKYDRRSNILHFVTYNVKQLPHVLERSGETERTCRIPEALLRRIPTIDVIVFEEMFMRGCIKNKVEMKRLLRPFGFAWTYQPSDDDLQLPKFVGSGVMIASRWPITAVGHHAYTVAAKPDSADLMAAKGVVYAAIKKGERKYHIFGTHLQAHGNYLADSIRQQQVREIYKFYEKQKIPRDEAVFFAGDLNEDWYDDRDKVNKMMKTLRARMTKIVGSFPYTTDPKNPLGGGGSWLDYIFTSEDHPTPKNATMRSIDLRAPKPFPYCGYSPLLWNYVAPSSILCLEKKSTDYLSDHLLAYGIFEF